jgi:inner membrane protein
MDNLTHTLFGATLARTPLDRAGRGATAALILASNAPDVDIVTTLNGAINYLEWHRGPTHGLLGVVGLGLLVAGIVWIGSRLLDRDRTARHANFTSLAAVSSFGVLCHVLMDLPTSYGTRLLSPFDWHWYAVDLMPIIDIYLLAALAGCLWFGNRVEWRRRNVVIALTFMVVNYGVRIAAHREALAAAPQVFGPTMPARCDASRAQGPFVDRWPIHEELSENDRQRRCLLEIVALPTFTSPFQWRLVAQVSNAYETRDIDLLELARGEPAESSTAPWRLVQRVPNRWTPMTLAAAQTETARIFLGFSRLPAARAAQEPDGNTVISWSDLRFTTGASRNLQDARRADFFTVTVVMAPDGRIVEHRLGE